MVLLVLITVDITAMFILPSFGVPLPENVGGILGILFTLGFVLILFTNFKNTVEQEQLEDVRATNRELEALSAELEKRVELRTSELEESNKRNESRASQLEAIANTARTTATAKTLDELLSSITKEVSKRFNFYHVGIFLLDSNKEYAILSAANSEGGQDMLARGHRLKVGEQGIVGYTTLSGNPRIALDVGDDAVYFNNPDLPETHSEVALPLKFGTEIIGALDIQSMESNAFTQEGVDIFSVLADQISVAIQNTRSLEQAKQALQELKVASRQVTDQEWKGFVETVKTRGYRYDGIKPEPLKETAKSIDDQESLLLPIQLRGQTIGRLKLRASEKAHIWTDDEMAIIESTAERVALALESARLLEDAQKRAARETFLSEMSTKLSTSYQLDSILRDTVEDLGETLKGSKVTFQLVNPSAPPSEEKENGKPKSSRRPE
jgi:GAF domain-containing protein